MAYVMSVNEQKIVDNIPIPTYYNEQIVPNKPGFNLISPLRPSGKCPFHTDTDPSLHYWDSNKMFKCFGCGEAGSVIKMHMLWEREYNRRFITKDEAIKELARMYNIELELDESGDVKVESIFDTAKRVFDKKQYDNNALSMDKMTVAGFRTFNNQAKDTVARAPYIMGEQAANMFYKLDLTLSARLADSKEGHKQW